MTATADRNPTLDSRAVVARAVAIRHDLHAHPELGYQEQRTSAVVAAELARLGIPHTTGHAGGTGVVGLIQGGAGPGPCVALRADMDALPILETTNLPYASTTPGIMHACGHDGHTAILLGAAAVLSAAAPRLKGSIKLIFQPAEEGGCGAEKFADEGVLDAPRVDAIFGLHGWPGLKVGMAGTRPGPLLASVDGFTVTITGKGCHAATPHTGIDPILCGAAMVQALQSVVSRETDANEAVVLSVSQFHAGSAFNVIPDQAQINGTLRALTKPRREAALASFERICRSIAEAHRCTVAFAYHGTTPPTTNTPELAAFVRNVATDLLGPSAYIPVDRAAMWGEDFAFYLQRVPGCFFVLGVQPPDRDSYPMLHNPNFDFNDDAVPHGIRLMSELAVRYLAGPPQAT